MLITLSGLPGSGTSTVARSAATRLGLAHLDGGTVFRSLAAEHGLSLAEFARLAEADASIDRSLDDRLLDRARDGHVLLESRLAGWLATRGGLDALRVWIACDDRERARRVAGREGHDLDAAVTANAEREASERQRYQDFYGIDLTDLGIYDLVIDSTSSGPDEIVAMLVDAATARFA
ncbi:MAG: AAA family ATPase [Acidimicrobiales bacterium]|nr:AAA family ATPase [Acidimicrobiales bacterium]HRW37011.1 AAA family ATPase [Aquihabitans sp.]